MAFGKKIYDFFCNWEWFVKCRFFPTMVNYHGPLGVSNLSDSKYIYLKKTEWVYLWWLILYSFSLALTKEWYNVPIRLRYNLPNKSSKLQFIHNSASNQIGIKQVLSPYYQTKLSVSLRELLIRLYIFRNRLERPEFIWHDMTFQ